jgi:hypothetical protein
VDEHQFQRRYPDYNVLDKWSSPDWDDQTREVVRQRLEEIPPIRFFTDEEAGLLAAIAERLSIHYFNCSKSLIDHRSNRGTHRRSSLRRERKRLAFEFLVFDNRKSCVSSKKFKKRD